jgi:hypothetical protein
MNAYIVAYSGEYRGDCKKELPQGRCYEEELQHWINSVIDKK